MNITSQKLAISNYIKNTRSELGISQSKLAEFSKVKQKDISRLESGRENPTLETLLRIFEVLKLQVILK